jgi:glutamate dehydrogenase/leucine dehydrogenase
MSSVAFERFNRSAESKLTSKEIEELNQPAAVHHFVNNEGNAAIVRVQHRIGEDGSGGGLKMLEMEPGKTIDEALASAFTKAAALATAMENKASVINLTLPNGIGEDVGGAKGVAYVPAGTLGSREQRDAILSEYVQTQAAKGVLGVKIDRHAPDMNTGPEDMNVMGRTLEEVTQDKMAIAAFSGKSIEHGGLRGREIATSQGMVYTLQKHLETLGLNPRSTTVAVQGAGNVGYHFARLASEYLGVKIVGISDKDKAIMADANAPILVDETITFANRGIHTWNEELHQRHNNPDDLLGMPVDVLVFAAAPNTVTEEKSNKEQLKAKIHLYGSNNPVDSEGIDYYLKNGVSILPDILSNAGGFAASNMEYNQNINGVTWEEGMVLGALKKIMHDAYDRVLSEARDPRNMVDPAFDVAVKVRHNRYKSELLVPSQG